jgi:EAL domain-containing protein (putative c-di-GMP-specific phosphodiesterase class I)
VIGIAKAFDIQVIAEGVETWQQATGLLDLDCQIAQGFAIAQPMPADELINWAEHFRLPKFDGTP